MPRRNIRIQSISDTLVFAQSIREKNQEHVVGLYLSARTDLLHVQTISIGSLNQNILTARDVFAPAFTRACCAVILIHNHPSGDPSPSQEDIAVTERLSQAGKYLGIQILDHIIVSKNTHFSFREKGLLDDP